MPVEAVVSDREVAPPSTPLHVAASCGALARGGGRVRGLPPVGSRRPWLCTYSYADPAAQGTTTFQTLAELIFG